jgi:hypothetical protein
MLAGGEEKVCDVFADLATGRDTPSVDACPFGGVLVREEACFSFAAALSKGFA